MSDKYNTKLIKRRLFRAKMVSRVLVRLPFIRCVILNGSLASGNHKKSSDIDILIITKKNRIYSARFFVNAVSTLLRIKRSKDEGKPHDGKFCFNYFLTEDFLKIPTGRGRLVDQYCASNYSKSIFLAGEMKLYDDFMQSNKNLFTNFRIKSKKSKVKNHKNNFRTSLLQSLAEKIFNKKFEELIKKYQIRKIQSDPRTKEYPDLIAYNDKELRFHPPKRGLPHNISSSNCS